jgi:hypothetical protein
MQNWTPKPSVNNGTPVAGQRLAVGSSAVAFSSAFYSATNLVTLQVFAADVYCTVDGSVPSATNGYQLFAGKVYNWNPLTAKYARFIEATTTSSSIQSFEFQIAPDMPALTDNSVAKSSSAP